MRELLGAIFLVLCLTSAANADQWVFNGYYWVFVQSPPVVFYVPQTVTIQQNVNVLVPVVIEGNRPMFNYDNRFFINEPKVLVPLEPRYFRNYHHYYRYNY